MPTMFDPAARAAMIARLDRLTAGQQPRWGGLTAAGMVYHLNAQLRSMAGELAVKPLATPALFKTAFFHWLIIDSPMPWPKGAPTAPEVLTDAPGDLTGLVAELKQRLERYAALGEANGAAVHSGFGPLTGKKMGKLLWKHWNHHLTQFGL